MNIEHDLDENDAGQPLKSKFTSNGFPAPEGLLQETRHKHNKYLTLQITMYEYDLLNNDDRGMEGKFRLMSSGKQDGVFHLVKMA
jgi:hypothetical protein